MRFLKRFDLRLAPLLIIGFASAVIVLPGQLMLVFGGDFNLGMYLLGGANVVIGSGLGARFPTLAPTEYASDEENRRYNQEIRELVSGSIVALATQLVTFYLIVIVAFLFGGTTDSTLWFMSMMFTLFGLMSLVVGFVAGLLVVTPIAILVRYITLKSTRKVTGAFLPVVAAILLLTVAFSITAVLAIEDPSKQSDYSDHFFVHLFVLLTGKEIFGITIKSQEMAWAARVIVVIMIPFVIYGRRLTRDYLEKARLAKNKLENAKAQFKQDRLTKKARPRHPARNGEATH